MYKYTNEAARINTTRTMIAVRFFVSLIALRRLGSTLGSLSQRIMGPSCSDGYSQKAQCRSSRTA